MELNKKSLDDLISATDKIVAANAHKEETLFGDVNNVDKVKKILGLDAQDPEKSYSLYYNNIQNFLNKFLPKDNEISTVIRQEVCILLSHKELKNISSGVRGSDSRMATTQDMENMIDVLSEWSENPNDYLKLANILLRKCKQLGYTPEERVIADYMKG